jgi:hypothetical protein
MIINSPSRNDFENVAKENLTQAFFLLYAVYRDYENGNDDIETDEVLLDAVWKYNQGTIRTALILLHQGIEGLMKGIICESSPLLLVDKPRSDWPSLPGLKDQDFDSLFTIGNESLLRTFCAVNTTIKVNEEFIGIIDEIRRKRNQAIHGIGKADLTPKYILTKILFVFTAWFGKDEWLAELKRNVIENPIFGFFDYDFEEAMFYQYLDFLEEIVGKRILSAHVKVEILGHRYFCPHCKAEVESRTDFGFMTSKWAVLHPNLPTSTTIMCVNCSTSTEVFRKDCEEKDCKGNVIFKYDGEGGITCCLTCFEEQSV